MRNPISRTQVMNVGYLLGAKARGESYSLAMIIIITSVGVQIGMLI